MSGAMNVLSRSRTAQFVSWDPQFTVWDPNTDTRIAGYKRGRYLGSTQTHWYVDIDGTTTTLDKDRWAPCLR